MRAAARVFAPATTPAPDACFHLAEIRQTLGSFASLNNLVLDEVVSKFKALKCGKSWPQKSL
jgi:hypothetical protein